MGNDTKNKGEPSKNKGDVRREAGSFRVNRSLLNRLRHNKNVEVNTIDRLCNILGCKVEDIMEHVPDDNKF